MHLATRIRQGVQIKYAEAYRLRVQQQLNAAPPAYSVSAVTTGCASAPAHESYENINK